MESEARTITDWRRVAMWWTLTAAAAAAILLGLGGFLSGDISRVVILMVAMVTSILIAKFDLGVPGTDSTFYPKTVFAFWGTATMGPYGGVLLMLSASAAERFAQRDERSATAVRHITRDVVSAAAGAVSYYAVLGLFDGSYTTVVAGRFLIPNEVMVAACVMAAAHFLAASAVDILEAVFSGKHVGRSSAAELLRVPLAGHLTALAVAIVLFLTFNHFGIEFGLVLLPLAIGTNFAHRIHRRSLAEKTRELREASRLHLATVEALATAIDARDQVGLGHVRRTQIYAVGLGRIMGLGEGEIDALRTGALLHDIGKLAVPDHILNKPGRLTQAEMEKTKIHSSVGASILEKVGFPTPVVPTVKYHHEHWDGSGYPEGLRGSHIPLTARILSVADAFDTLRGARPYRPAVSRDEACNFLRAGAGSQFDPKVVDLLLRHLKEFESEIEAEGLKYETPGLAAQTASGGDYVEEIKRANREVYTLYSLAREFSSSLTLDEAMSLFTSKIRDFVPYDACAVFLLEDGGEFATAVHAAGPQSGFLRGQRIRVGDGPSGFALQKNTAIENVDPALDLDGDLKVFRTMIARPLVAENKVIGVISLYTAQIANYVDEHLRLLDTVCPIGADAIAKTLRHAQAATHALTDPITGLPNARCLQIEFEKEVKRSIRSGSAFQILMLDLDGFKAVNDTFGHKVGDRLLIELGGVIRGQLREYDFLARYAGDEFVALIPETDQESVDELCRRIEEAVESFGLDVPGGNTARVGVSIGSAAYPNQGDSFDQVIISADKAMYLNKSIRKKKRAQYEELVNPKPMAQEFQHSQPGSVEEHDDAIHLTGDLLVVELYDTNLVA